MYYRLWAYLRVLIILISIAAILGAVAFRASEDSYAQSEQLYYRQLTVEVGTAVANALNNVTRTVEAPLRQYRLLTVTADDQLDTLAEQYNTTADVIRMANSLLPGVNTGDGNQLIIPEGVTAFDPPRRLTIHRATVGETLEALAQLNDLALRIVLEDNPVLAERALMPGDVVFIAELI